MAGLLFQISQPIYLCFYFTFKRHKESKNLKILSKIIKPNMHIVDIGANVGFFSHFFLNLVSQGKVYAIEPNQLLIPSLIKIKKKFQSFEIINKVLGNFQTPTLVDFYPSELINIDGRAFCNKFSSNNFYKIEGISFDLCFEGKKIDFVKIDIQGFEIEALKGMTNFLVKDVILYLEFWPEGIKEAGQEPVDLIRLLRNFDFTILLIRYGLMEIDENNWFSYFLDNDYFDDSNILCFKHQDKERIFRLLGLQ